MNILSVDPGKKCAGWAMWLRDSLRQVGAIKEDDIQEIKAVCESIGKLGPWTLVVEDQDAPNTWKSAAGVKSVLLSRGHWEALSIVNGCKRVVVISPQTWKKSIGAAGKKTEQSKAISLMAASTVTTEKVNHNTADAINLGRYVIKEPGLLEAGE